MRQVCRMTFLFVGSPLANPRSLPKASLRLPPAGIALAVLFNSSKPVMLT